MARLYRLHTSFYSLAIVTMALSCIVCEIQRLIGRKSRNFYTPPVFSALGGGDPVGISWRCLMLVKLEWLGYRTLKKNYGDMLSRFYLIPERYGRTDRQTERFAISISRVSIGLLTRDKNWLQTALLSDLQLFCIPVCLSVRLSVTFRYYVKTA